MHTREELLGKLAAVRDNLDSHKYAAPEMREFWINEIKENAQVDDDDEIEGNEN